MAAPLLEQTIGHQRLQSWSYLAACPQTRQAVIIDAGGSAEAIVTMAGGFDIRAIVLTHGHLDHWEGAPELKRQLGVPVLAHPADFDRIGFAPDDAVEDGAELVAGTLRFQVLHTPGHTAGSICLLLDDLLFSGDTLFPGGPGRTQSPADLQQELESIRSRLLVLPEHTRVLPGHGAPTTIGGSRAEYDIFASRPHPPDLFGDVTWAG